MIQNSKVGALPVVDDVGRLQGILSVRDLLRAFINVLGIGQPGTLLCILVEEKVGQLKRIVDAITDMGVSFGSVLVARYWDEDKRAVFPYLLTQNVAQVKKKLQDMGYDAARSDAVVYGPAAGRGTARGQAEVVSRAHALPVRGLVHLPA